MSNHDYGQRPYYQQPPRKRRWPKVVIGILVGLLVIGACSAMVAGNPATAPAVSNGAPNQAPSLADALSNTVTFTVEGDGKATVSYMKSGGTEQREVSLPWTADVETDFVSSLTAQKKSGGSGEITCRITGADGDVIAESTSAGAYAVVSCAG